jgi:hypothetical protein
VEDLDLRVSPGAKAVRGILSNFFIEAEAIL